MKKYKDYSVNDSNFDYYGNKRIDAKEKERILRETILENVTPDYGQFFENVNLLEHSISYLNQDIVIGEHAFFGKFLMIDDTLQMTEKDEFSYSEMLVHPTFNKDATKVLIIGGGDGCILREVLKYDVKKVDLVEIDEVALKLCQRYFNKEAFEDERVSIHIDDGERYVRHTSTHYDHIIVDRPSPIPQAESLYLPVFYRMLRYRLKEEGTVIIQGNDPLYDEQLVKRDLKNIRDEYNYVVPYWTIVPTYLGGFYLVFACSNVEQPFRINDIETKYYNEDVMKMCTLFPKHIKKSINKSD